MARGIIPVMRLLAGGARAPAEIAARSDLSLHDASGALESLRDEYGAAEEDSEAGGERGSAWRLTFEPEWLDETRLRAALSPAPVRVLDEAPCTNELAKAAEPESVIFAEHQTRGRGRSGRRWVAMPGGSVMASARFGSIPHAAEGLPLAVGAELWRTLGGGGLRLKWPNDLLDASGRKIGGILMEASAGGVVAGAGINLVMTPALRRAAGRNAAALPEAPPRNECAALVAGAMRSAAAKFARAGLAAFMDDALEGHCFRAGDPLSFDCGSGGEERGRFAGFDRRGAILVRSGGRVRAYSAGEASHVAGC